MEEAFINAFLELAFSCLLVDISCVLSISILECKADGVIDGRDSKMCTYSSRFELGNAIYIQYNLAAHQITGSKSL